MGNTDASTWVMLPPATCRLGSCPVSETTWVDDFFMATPVAVCGGSAPSLMSQDSHRGRSFRARYCRAWRRLALPPARPALARDRGMGPWAWDGPPTLAALPHKLASSN